MLILAGRVALNVMDFEPESCRCVGATSTYLDATVALSIAILVSSSGCQSWLNNVFVVVLIVVIFTQLEC